MKLIGISILTAMASALIGACGSDSPETAAAAIEARAHGTVDSIFPIEEEIRRFRAVLGPDPVKLAGGAGSLDALVERFERALVEADTAAFADMLMTRDEFGWLYYPSTIFTAPPYQLAPGLVWFQVENGSSRGLGRLLDRLGGRPIEFGGHTCASEPLIQGVSRVWERCAVRFEAPDEDPRELELFGSILERDGVFKFVSYTNGF
jgi:hypothetical protein